MKTIERNDHWTNMVHDNQFLYSLLAIILIAIMLFDFIFILILSIIGYMAQLEFQKRISTYSLQKKRIIIGGLLGTVVVFVTTLFLGFSYFFNSLDKIPGKANKINLMNDLIAWLTPLKLTMTQIASNFLNNQEAVNLVDKKISESISNGAEFLVSSLLYFVTLFPEKLLSLFIFFISYWIVARSYKSVKFKIFIHTKSIYALDHLKTLFLYSELSAYDTLVSTIAVAMTQGIIISAGALISGNDLWPIYFIFAFGFSFVPVVGLLPIIIFGAFHGYYLHGFSSLILFCTFGLIASTMDNVLRVLLLSQAKEIIHPMISFFCLIGSLSLFGLKGLILGPFLLSFAGYLLNGESAQSASK